MHVVQCSFPRISYYCLFLADLVVSNNIFCRLEIPAHVLVFDNQLWKYQDFGTKVNSYGRNDHLPSFSSKLKIYLLQFKFCTLPFPNIFSIMISVPLWLPNMVLYYSILSCSQFVSLTPVPFLL